RAPAGERPGPISWQEPLAIFVRKRRQWLRADRRAVAKHDLGAGVGGVERPPRAVVVDAIDGVDVSIREPGRPMPAETRAIGGELAQGITTFDAALAFRFSSEIGRIVRAGHEDTHRRVARRAAVRGWCARSTVFAVWAVACLL